MRTSPLRTRIKGGGRYGLSETYCPDCGATDHWRDLGGGKSEHVEVNHSPWCPHAPKSAEVSADAPAEATA